MRRLVLLGPPASGKGTQGRMLAEALRVPHVSSGQLLRRSVENGDPHGITAFVARGELVPDEVVEAVLRPALGEGFVLDGYPRTAVQASRLDDLLEELGAPLDAVVELVVNDEDLERRMDQRAEAEGRADDRPEVFRRRLDDYRGEIQGLRSHYADRLITVDGSGGVDEVFERLTAAGVSPLQNSQ